MKSILVETFLSRNVGAPQTEVRFTDDNGVTHSGWAIAKPLNYDSEYVPEEDRKAMAQEVLDGRAIAVHYTEDEIAAGEVPTLYKEHVRMNEKNKMVDNGDAENAHR